MTFEIYHLQGAWLVAQLALYTAAILGALTLHLFSFDKNFAGANVVIRQLWPQKSDVFYHRLNFIIMMIVGPLVGFILLEPQKAHQAFVAGASWVGVVNTAIAKAAGANKTKSKGSAES
jgi:hypothetical protein